MSLPPEIEKPPTPMRCRRLGLSRRCCGYAACQPPNSLLPTANTRGTSPAKNAARSQSPKYASRTLSISPPQCFRKIYTWLDTVGFAARRTCQIIKVFCTRLEGVSVIVATAIFCRKRYGHARIGFNRTAGTRTHRKLAPPDAIAVIHGSNHGFGAIPEAAIAADSVRGGDFQIIVLRRVKLFAHGPPRKS